ncbi:hypothetical protein IC582_011222 [Cucumis melo]
MLSSMDLCFFVIVSGCGWADSFSFNEPLLLLDLAIVGLFFLLYLCMDVVVSAHFVLMWLWMWKLVSREMLIRCGSAKRSRVISKTLVVDIIRLGSKFF